MSLCSEAPQALGFVRVSREKVSKAAREMLAAIKEDRERMCDDWVKTDLETRVMLWKWAGRFLGLKKPTEEASRKRLETTVNDLGMTPKEDIGCCYGGTEQKIREILGAVEEAEGRSIFLSTEGLRVCGMVGKGSLTL